MTITLSKQQGDAVKAVSQWYRSADNINHFSLEGFAGSGKSTILPYIIDDCGLSPRDVSFCAPTGKAAKVMTSKLGGPIASTIHSLIYTPKMMKIDALIAQISNIKHQLELMIRDGLKETLDYDLLLESLKMTEEDLDKSYDKDDGPKFTLNVDSNIRQSKLVVVDESSMVNKEMAEDLARFGVPILAMGDSGQLPPVEGSHGLLRDRPDFFLSEIHRQALDNPIIKLATMARQGEYIPYGEYGNGIKVVERRDDDVTFNEDSNAMVIAGTHRKRWRLTKRIRKVFEFDEDYPMEGEPLMVCKNFKRNDRLLYINGDIVTCAKDAEDFANGQASFQIEFLDELGDLKKEYAFQGLFEEHIFKERNKTTAPKQLAYKSKTTNLNLDFSWVITCHKSQGSQWDEVVVHDESSIFKDQAPRWLYTAITRAAEKLTIVR